jgi:H+-translocating NAD(P) transhydrogenase subunit alpha
MTTVAVLKETLGGEQRVALVPDSVQKLIKLGLRVVVEAGAGSASSIADADYERAGASITPSAAAAASGAQVVLKVQGPDEEEVGVLGAGTLLIGFLQPGRGSVLLERLAARRVDAMAMERVPRTTRAQAVDALSSQATVAGYKAVLLGASLCPRLLPMLTTAAGTLTPAKVLVLGAGVAGLQAVATARRLGAVVSAFDVRPAVREQVQSLGAKFVEMQGLGGAAEGAGGYAAELGEDQQRRVFEAIAGQLGDADLVITTAQIPGKPAPRLITLKMLRGMKRGAVVVDLAAESGGNCEGTTPGEAVREGGVTLLGPTNLAATVPLHASMMYSRNLVALLSLVVTGGTLKLDLADDIVAAMLVTSNGAVRL